MGTATAQTITRVTSERHGTIMVTGCVFATYAAHSNIYRCSGDFTADGGTFGVRGVTFRHTGRLSYGDRTGGIVSGPSDHTADVESRWEVGVKSAITLTLAAAALGALALRRRVHRIGAARGRE